MSDRSLSLCRLRHHSRLIGPTQRLWPRPACDRARYSSGGSVVQAAQDQRPLLACGLFSSSMQVATTGNSQTVTNDRIRPHSRHIARRFLSMRQACTLPALGLLLCS